MSILLLLLASIILIKLLLLVLLLVLLVTIDFINQRVHSTTLIVFRLFFKAVKIVVIAIAAEPVWKKPFC